MKINEIILESPIHVPDDMKQHWIEDSAISDNAIEREYTCLGTLERENNYDFFIHNDLDRAIITTRAISTLTNIEKNKLIVDLHFKTKINIPVKNQLQVELVTTHKKYREMSLASILYIVLVKNGYTIVSDLYHYNGGVALWEKLGRESEARKCVVKIWNIKQNSWLKDDSNEILKWNGENLAYHEIWQYISDTETEEKLLVLLKH